MMQHLVLLVLFGISTLDQSAPANEISRVSFAARADGRGIVMRVHASRPIEAPDMLVIQEDFEEALVVIENATLSRSVVRDRQMGPVLSYRLDERRGDVMIRLQFGAKRLVRLVAYPDKASADALVALSYASVGAVSPQADGITVPVVPATYRAERPFNEELTSASAERWRLDCVVIDAGHGGKDPGAVAHGVQEKNVNLAVARRLAERVRSELGLEVVMTRSDDRFIPLTRRGEIANQECGKLFVSIHVNAAPRREAQGTEIYFLGLHKTEAARRVMERENSVIRLEQNQEQYEAFSDEQYIFQTLAQSVYLRESEELAELVDREFGESAKFGRGVKQAGFLVLWKASMPAILVELGFVTNKTEARYLASEKGQERLADAIFRAIQAYRNTYERTTTASSFSD